MNKLSVNLSNCFGIKKLQHEFDFSNGNVFSIYARNGMMKTSFAKTFQLIQKGKDESICDALFGINGSAEVLIDGNPIQREQIFTIRSFESAYESDVTTLLVNDETREKLKAVFKIRTSLLKKLEDHSGLKIKKIQGGKNVFELEPRISEDFDFEDSSILLNLKELHAFVPEVFFDDVVYSTIFDSTALKKIYDPIFQEGIQKFLDASNKIYDSFEYLEKGLFTYPKLKELKKSLEKNAFFVKNNRILLADKIEIHDIKTLDLQIQEIDTEIKKSPEFQKIESLLGDASGRLLKDVIETHPEIIEYLIIEKLPILRKSLWGSYLKKNETLFLDLLTKYESVAADIDYASLEDTQWQKALDIFKQRFFVPFTMSISNLKGAIIGESVPQAEFIFENDGNNKTINRNTLEELDVLSQGEKRALYLLNIIFDLEKIKNNGNECILIVDDIADSFDYKNKYAIIEYLYDLAEEENIYMLIFTHNYDFHRTMSSRLGLERKNNLYVEDKTTGLTLETEHYQKQPFKSWKECLTKKQILAMIPFVRNLCEYGKERCISRPGKDYDLLTSLLHNKKGTANITFAVLEPLYQEYVGIKCFPAFIEKDSLVIDTLFEISDGITLHDTILENKIVLAMAIRHKAEAFMLQEIGSCEKIVQWGSKNNRQEGDCSTFLLSMENKKNQTRELFNVYKQVCTSDNIVILNKVNIMTPEHIHLNSFMFEPLIDMDINELLGLYEHVKTL